MKNLKYIIFSFALVFFGINAVSAQQIRTAVSDANGVISLDASQPAAEKYTIDVSNMNFKNAAEAEQKFAYLNKSPLVEYKVDLANNKVEITLRDILTLSQHRRTTQQWNQILNNLAAKR